MAKSIKKLSEVSILSLQRDAQTLLADYNIWGKLNKPGPNEYVMNMHPFGPCHIIFCCFLPSLVE